jgi:glycerophosphoryl diester phosphodiesterase
VVVFHDRLLDEKTSERGPVSARSLDELRRLDIGTWFDAQHPESPTKFAGTPLVSLAEVFERFGTRLAYQIELKGEDPGLADRVLALIARAAVERRVMISSSRVFLLDRTRALDASIPIVLLIGDERELRAAAGAQGAAMELGQLQRGWIDRAARSRFDEVALPAENLTAAVVIHAHARGLEIGAYRVPSKEEMERVVALGADAMTINWPDWAVEYLRKSSGRVRQVW